MINIDSTDKKILDILQHNARISNLELAELVNLSPTPCARRVKQLEENGIIERHITVLNQEKLDLKLTIILAVTLEKHNSDTFARFESEIINFPEIISCSVVTGRKEDYILKVVAKDMKHYEEFLLKRLNNVQGIQNMHTSFELRKVIDKGALPIF